MLLWNVGAYARQPTPYLPDPKLTPGDVFDVTIEDICTPGYSKKVRMVPKSLRDQAFRNYGVEQHQGVDYQLDHLIPLSIGGSNSIRNLWPQPNHTSPWGARAKDRLENRVRRLVCAGELDLEIAQHEIAADWTEAYRNFVGGSPPAVARSEPLLVPSASEGQTRPKANAPNAREHEVWVNTRSSKYWRQGSRYFGKTKHGEFMTEAAAIERGYKPAGGTGR